MATPLRRHSCAPIEPGCSRSTSRRGRRPDPRPAWRRPPRRALRPPRGRGAAGSARRPRGDPAACPACARAPAPCGGGGRLRRGWPAASPPCPACARGRRRAAPSPAAAGGRCGSRRATAAPCPRRRATRRCPPSWCRRRPPRGAAAPGRFSERQRAWRVRAAPSAPATSSHTIRAGSLACPLAADAASQASPAWRRPGHQGLRSRRHPGDAPAARSGDALTGFSPASAGSRAWGGRP